MEKLQGDLSLSGRLKNYIFIMNTLIQHENLGGLESTQVWKLLEIGRMVLHLSGVKPISSKIAYLHGELSLVTSQIMRKDGDHFLAAWQQQLSKHLSGARPPGGKVFERHVTQAGMHCEVACYTSRPALCTKVADSMKKWAERVLRDTAYGP